MIKKIIFDLDDTLVQTGIIYERVIKEFVETLIKDLNINKMSFDEIYKIQEEIDIKLIAEYGFTTVRFPLSFSETYKYICKKLNIKFNKSQDEKLSSIGEKVFNTIPELCEGVIEILEYFKNKYNLVIYTLGDEKVQKDKIVENNLHNYIDKYLIVQEKNIDTLKSVCDDTPFNECAIVGDSIRGEIEPGVKLGMKAFYLEKPKKWTYLHYDMEGEYTSIKSLPELKNYL